MRQQPSTDGPPCSCSSAPANVSLPPTPWQLCTFIVALALHTQFLFARSAITHHCPIGNLFEILAYTLWSIALAYLLVGRLYRMTLLGALTAPTLFLSLLLIQLFNIDTNPSFSQKLSPALELHASLSILAYGALGIAALTGLIYLIQERILKRKLLTSWLSSFPPLSDLARVNRQLLIYSLVLLTLGLLSGFRVTPSGDSTKLIVISILWLLYTGITVANITHRLSPRKTALASLLLYALMLSTFWNVNQIPSP